MNEAPGFDLQGWLTLYGPLGLGWAVAGLLWRRLTERDREVDATVATVIKALTESTAARADETRARDEQVRRLEALTRTVEQIGRGRA